MRPPGQRHTSNRPTDAKRLPPNTPDATHAAAHSPEHEDLYATISRLSSQATAELAKPSYTQAPLAPTLTREHHTRPRAHQRARTTTTGAPTERSHQRTLSLNRHALHNAHHHNDGPHIADSRRRGQDPTNRPYARAQPTHSTTRLHSERPSRYRPITSSGPPRDSNQRAHLPP